jgi:signal-transduction protein with cAMP-binding, CBS, and nucleotidyltransferase domain
MVTAELLAQHRIFDNLSEKMSKAIQEQAEIAPYAPGEVIVPAGQPFTFFGVLLEGEATAYLAESEGEPVPALGSG